MKKGLRSHKWFLGANETGLLHMGALRSSGINMDDYTGQPIVGIANTWGMLPIPKKMRQQGITDMVRIIHARMCGTIFGTVVLDVAPEAAIGGMLAFIKNGNHLTIDIPNRKINVEKTEELAIRKANWPPAVSKQKQGYPKLYTREVMKADRAAPWTF